MGFKIPTMKNSNKVKIGCCIYTILLLSAALSAGAPFGPDGTYTWGIGNKHLNIPIGSIITNATLTIHNPAFGLPLNEGVVYVHLLDNPNATITEYVDDQVGDYFDGYGVYLLRITPFTLSSSPSSITIELDKLDRLPSIISPTPFGDSSPASAGPVPVTYDSAMPELLDYAGTGRSFGFGLDCDGFTFDALTLELTVGSMTSSIPENRLVFTAKNPNRPPVATFDSYTFMQNDPAQTLFVLSNDSDPDGDPLSISTITQPLYGQAEIVENNTAIRYTPSVGYSGFEWFVYTVSDGNGGTASAASIVRVQATHTLSITAINGSIAKSPDKTNYLQGETVMLTAAADTGYTFVGWSGDVSGTVNPISIALAADMSVAANFSPISPSVPTDTIYENATEMTFNGIDSYQSISTTGWNLNGTTVTFWCKADTLAGSHYLLGHTVGSWSNRIQLYIRDGQFCLGLGNTHDLRSNIYTLQAEQWYFVSLSWDGTHYSIRINDQAAASGTYAGLTAFSGFADFGNTGNPNWRTHEVFSGTIDDIRIYARALSQAESVRLYTYGRNEFH